MDNTTPHLEWTTHQLLDEPKKGIFAVLAVSAVSLLVHISFEETYFTALSIVFLTGSLSKFFFPVTYSFFDTHLRIRGLLFPHDRPWTEFKRIVKFPDGVLLSPFVTPTRLDNYRAMFIRYKANSDEILQFLEEKVKQE